MTCDDVKPLLSARADNEIGPTDRAALDSHVMACPSCASDLNEVESIGSWIRDRMPYYEAPAHLRNQVRLALRGAEYFDKDLHRTSWKVWGALAAAVAFCALATAPFLMSERNQRQLIAEELLSAHERALVGNSVDVISSSQHTVKPWFNGKLPFSPPVTDLASNGFPLKRGRVDYAGEQAVAVLVYGRRLHRIDVFVWPSAGRTSPPEHFERNGYSEISWVKDKFFFTAVSDLGATELAGFAKLLEIH